MNINKTTWSELRIGDIVTRLPSAASLFRSSGVDFCCGGHRPLREALQADGREADALDAALDTLQQRALSAEDGVAYTEMAPSDLTNLIEERHHSYLRTALPRVGELAQKVLSAHGQRHPELFRIHSLFGHLRTDLEQHLIKEEALLFPMLGARDPAQAEAVGSLAQEIRAEHEAAGKVLHELRELTDGYETPADGCQTYVKFMDALAELEIDLFQHIHLENNILLKDQEAAA